MENTTSMQGGDSPDAKRFGYRDPKVWKHGDQWYRVIGYSKLA